MDLLKLLQARTNISAVLMKISLSLDEIKKKNQQRLDYIEPMEKSIEQLNYSYKRFIELESEWRTARQRNFDLELIVAKQNQEIEKLKDIIDTQNKMNAL
jgi:hypothetical protein